MSALYAWQLKDWALLASYFKQQRIPQALLLAGQGGLGQESLARVFAQALLCHQRQANEQACGQCQACLLFNADTHPDFFVVAPEEGVKTISVDTMRNLMAKLTLKPQYSAHRVVLIQPADAMNANAYNAFLKYLEEPTERTVLLLLTEQPYKLPATILSRCQSLQVSTPAPSEALAWLKQQKPTLSETQASQLLMLAQQAPILALDYAEQDVINQREQCFKDWLALARQQTHPVIIAEKWLKLSDATLLSWLNSWLSDLIKCKFQLASDYLCNKDLNKSLRELSNRLELKDLYPLYDLVLVSKQRLATTVNKQCLLEELLNRWTQINYTLNG